MTFNSACMAPAALMACRIANHVAWSDAQGVQPFDEVLKTDARIDDREAFILAGIHIDLRARHDGGGAGFGEWRWLGDLRRLRHADRQIALGDGDRGNPDIAADDDDARGLIDDDAGDGIGLDLQLLDFGHEIDV